MIANEEVFTIGQLADMLEEPPHRVDYIIRKLRLKPFDRVGTLRLFTKQQIDIVKNGLYNIQVRG